MKTRYILLSALLILVTNSVFSQVPGITSSNLPLVVINTKGRTILDDSKIDALKKVADSHDFKPYANDMYINLKLKHQE